MNWNDYTKLMEKRGIEAVARFYERRTGMKVIARAFECEAGKAEIVAHDPKRGTVFVSVTAGKDGAEAWGDAARQRMEKVAEAWFAARGEHGRKAHFDRAVVTGAEDDRCKVVYHPDYLLR